MDDEGQGDSSLEAHDSHAGTQVIPAVAPLRGVPQAFTELFHALSIVPGYVGSGFLCDPVQQLQEILPRTPCEPYPTTFHRPALRRPLKRVRASAKTAFAETSPEGFAMASS